MKSLTLLALCLFCLSCIERKEVAVLSNDFDFLLGNWDKTNTQPGIITKEHWRITSTADYRGHAYTLENGDTIFQEHMHLVNENDLWTLTIKAPQEDAVAFTVISFAPNTFTARNPENEFPTTISYSYFDDTLNARIANETQQIEFIFWREE